MSSGMDTFDTGMDGTRRRLFPDVGSDANVVDDETMSHSLLDDGVGFHEGSPTSVYEYPGQGQGKKRRLAPQIAMSEDGAEVSIDLASLTIAENLESPQSRPSLVGAYRQGSLLDADCTPTPPPSKGGVGKQQQSLFSNTALCCYGSSHNEEEYSVGGDQIERTISSFLEYPHTNLDSGCQEWQAWSFFLENETTTEDPSKETIKSNLRSRAFNLGARKLRVQQLRQDFDPFTSSPRRVPSPRLVKSRSFSVEAPRMPKDKNKSRNPFANVLHLCTMPENSTVESPLVVRHGFDSSNNEDICYDSDPEDFTKKGRDMASIRGKENLEKNQLYRYSYPRSINTSPTGKFEDDHRDGAFEAVVQEIFNGSTTLIYHPTSMSENGEIQPLTPIAVDAWLERGQRLMTIIQPKWMWKPKPRDKIGVENHQRVSIMGVELLDITRILKIHRVNRTRYPFAKPSSSFIMRTIDNDEFCFEAKSSEERDWLVYSMKLVIARFGAKVVMGDQKVYKEFFATSDGVPGEAPDLTQFHE